MAAPPPGSGATVDAVAEWLGTLGLTQDYSGHVRENDVDGAVLASLTKEDLKDALGLTVFGDRRKVELALGMAQAQPAAAAAAAPPAPAKPVGCFGKMVLWVDNKFDHLQDFIDNMERQLGITFEKRTSTDGAKRVVKVVGGKLAAVITNRQRGDDAEAGYHLAQLVQSMWASGEAATGGADACPPIIMYSTTADPQRCEQAGMKLAANFHELQRLLYAAQGKVLQ
eukprot:TRINITY_DN27008_c0_g1_i1.p1 TRINITY_DN27008_c0_g1~~TRINITY_DN27008_c0_g1_i1.p1  ORF type:complete len:226 (+),score=73.41 TRINITY_DN27008_c0_g1_i1:66-743(+)